MHLLRRPNKQVRRHPLVGPHRPVALRPRVARHPGPLAPAQSPALPKSPVRFLMHLLRRPNKPVRRRLLVALRPRVAHHPGPQASARGPAPPKSPVRPLIHLLRRL